ncbi:hypothetical protein ZWY2020_024003 [Hordeum vulgare]|nr:hypothetical protein ZWY2020_024003 [Hordeum vulgare]
MASPGRLGSLVQHASAVALSYGEAPTCWSWLLVVRGGIAAPGRTATEGAAEVAAASDVGSGGERDVKFRNQLPHRWMDFHRTIPTLFFFVWYPTLPLLRWIQRRLMAAAVGLDGGSQHCASRQRRGGGASEWRRRGCDMVAVTRGANGT